MTCSGHNTVTRVGLEPQTSGSGFRGVNHQATAPQIVECILADLGSLDLGIWILAGYLPYQRLF